MFTAVGAPLFWKVAMVSGTVGRELQLLPTVHSLPAPCQMPSTAPAGCAASPASATLASRPMRAVPSGPMTLPYSFRPASNARAAIVGNGIGCVFVVFEVVLRECRSTTSSSVPDRRVQLFGDG